MNILPLIVLGLVTIAVVAAVAIGAFALAAALSTGRVGQGEDPAERRSPSAALVAARRHAGVVDALAWAGLLVVGLLAERIGTTRTSALSTGVSAGVVTGLIPALAGTAALVVHAVGELTWPRPTGAVRRAPLMRRTVAGIAPRGLRRLVWVWAVGLVMTLVACGLTSSDGRSVRRTVELADGTVGGASAGPFPGWFYGVPLLVATALVLGAAEVVLRLVARRPAVVDTLPEDDLALRTVSARRVLRSAQLVLALTLAGVLFLAGHALRSVGSGGSFNGLTQESVAHVVGGSAVMVLGVAIACVGVALVLPFAGRPPAHPLRSAGEAAGTRSGRLPA